MVVITYILYPKTPSFLPKEILENHNRRASFFVKCLRPKHTSKEDLSFGIPDRWSAAAVTYSLLEGLAGVKDTATMFEK